MILLAQNRQADRDRIETERDRETNARQLAEAEFLAREIAGLRHLLEQKADRDDVVDALRELTGLLDRRLDVDPAAGRRETAGGGTSLDQPGG
jgi:uncharacterized membrane protein